MKHIRKTVRVTRLNRLFNDDIRNRIGIKSRFEFMRDSKYNGLNILQERKKINFPQSQIIK